MKKFIIALTVACVISSGCSKRQPSADAKAQEQTEKAMQESFSQSGMPAIKNFQERKLAKMIYELRDQEDLVCYAYLVSLQGKPIFLGKCIGFGLPYCVQYSNPERVVKTKEVVPRYTGQGNAYAGSSVSTIPQPEPNGLFMPETLSATWLMMIDPKTGEGRPTYIEPEIIVSPFPLI